MDSYSHLHATLEYNPFADPFAKQRCSPDPWATPFAATDPHAFDNTSQHFNSLDSNDFGTSSSEFKPLDDEPMNSPGPAHAADDDDNEPLGRNRSPGFRETFGASFSETATIPTKLAQSDEDSDDDKPIMQTLKHHDQDDSVPVSVYTLCPIHCSIVLRRHPRKQFKMTKKSNLYS